MIYRQATTKDIPAITALFERELQREANKEIISNCIDNFPSCVAVNDKGEMVGFVYCGGFAPDIIEIYNILVDSSQQSSGIGSTMMEKLITNIYHQGIYAGVILVNSYLYPDMKNPFRDGGNFYHRNGFTMISRTANTNIFYRRVA